MFPPRALKGKVQHGTLHQHCAHDWGHRQVLLDNLSQAWHQRSLHTFPLLPCWGLARRRRYRVLPGSDARWFRNGDKPPCTLGLRHGSSFKWWHLPKWQDWVTLQHQHGPREAEIEERREAEDVEAWIDPEGKRQSQVEGAQGNPKMKGSKKTQREEMAGYKKRWGHAKAQERRTGEGAGN